MTIRFLLTKGVVVRNNSTKLCVFTTLPARSKRQRKREVESPRRQSCTRKEFAVTRYLIQNRKLRRSPTNSRKRHVAQSHVGFFSPVVPIAPAAKTYSLRMDVYYMSDSIQYGSFRNPLYRDYEKFPYGTLENTLNSPPKSGGGVQQQRNQTSSTVAGQGNALTRRGGSRTLVCDGC